MALSSEDQGQSTEKTGKSKKKLLLVLLPVLAVCVIAGVVIGVTSHNGGVTAVMMRLQRLVGTVNLYDENGKEQSVKEQMRLSSGQSITTGDESLIMLSLDETKLITMEENSKAEVHAKGKALEFDLKEGNLFFNVTEKLEDGYTFDVKASSLICGIRGTSAYVGVDSNGNPILMVTDGTVELVAEHPLTHEKITIQVPPGQKATIHIENNEEGGGSISYQLEPFKEEDLPPSALNAIVESEDLTIRVLDSTGFSGDKIAALAAITSVNGTPIFGESDTIPLMGKRAEEMMKAAKEASEIAGDDLDLETAILTGMREVLDAGTDAGYEGDSLSELMDGAMDSMKKVCKEAADAGIEGDALLELLGGVSDAMKASTTESAGSNLSETEIKQMLAAATEGSVDATMQGTATQGAPALSADGAVDEQGDNGTDNTRTGTRNAGTGTTAQIPINGAVIPGTVIPGETPVPTPGTTPAPVDPATPADPTPPVGPTPPVTPGVYSVTLHPEGGTIQSGNITSYTQGVGAVLPTDVIKAETEAYTYAFDGWYTAQSGGTKVTAISAADTGDKVFYAHWINTPKHPVTVRFYNWDESLLIEQIVEQGERPVYAGPTPTCASTEEYSYTWAGWNEGEYQIGVPLAEAWEDTGYYAWFEPSPITYHITKQATNCTLTVKKQEGQEWVDADEVGFDTPVRFWADSTVGSQQTLTCTKTSDGTAVEYTYDQSIGGFVFTMPAGGVTITAIFGG